MITRDNYEAYALDFIEGALSVEDHALFVLFLEQNQDLQEEVLSMAEDLPLVSKETGKTLEDKSAWHKKSPIHTGNDDEYLIDSLEGNTTPEQELFVRLYIQENPHIEKKQKRYAQTVLKADMNMVFPKKDRLKKSLLWFYTKQFAPLAVAASLLLFWTYSIVLNDDVKPEYQAQKNEIIERREDITNKEPLKAAYPAIEKEKKVFVEQKSTQNTSLVSKRIPEEVLEEKTRVVFIDSLPKRTISTIQTQTNELALRTIQTVFFTDKNTSKVYAIEEKNIDGFAFLANIIKQKSAELVQERTQKKNSEEKQNNLWAWIEKETGIRVFKTQEISNHRVEIAMGNRIEIQSK